MQAFKSFTLRSTNQAHTRAKIGRWTYVLTTKLNYLEILKILNSNRRVRVSRFLPWTKVKFWSQNFFLPLALLAHGHTSKMSTKISFGHLVGSPKSGHTTPSFLPQLFLFLSLSPTTGH